MSNFLIFTNLALWAELVYSCSRDVRLCMYILSPFHVLDFEAYFAPTSWSPMSKIFRDSESLGKSAGKKWSQKWSFLLESGLKLPLKKVFFCADFALQNMVETTLPDGLETSGQRVINPPPPPPPIFFFNFF